MFTKNGPEFQCLKGQDQNSNLYKKKGQNSNVSNVVVRIPMPMKKRPNFQCLERYDQKTNMYKKRPRIPKLGRKRSEFKTAQK